MAQLKIVLLAATLGLTLAAGFATAQGFIPGRPDPELAAAQQAVDEAMEHLQRVHNSTSSANMRALAFLTLAHRELEAERNPTY